MNGTRIGLAIASLALATIPSASGQAPVGIFSDQRDVGTIPHPGSVRFDEAKHAYTVTGSGENMWLAKDALHYAWVRAEGDLAISADVSFLGRGQGPAPKGVPSSSARTSTPTPRMWTSRSTATASRPCNSALPRAI